MAFVYETIDGQRVENSVGAAFRRMAADFQAATGCSLHISSGTRTDAEQEAIFRARYVLAGQVNGRRVYDTRWWAGQMWYRISSAGTVAPPGSSNHQEGGPNGPRSIDVYDSGADAGVTRFGTRRNQWMHDNAHRYEFENEGEKFNEAWHKTFRGSLEDAVVPPQPPTNLPGPEAMLEWNWTGIQEMLRGTGRYNGRIDNDPGHGTISGFQDFLNDFGYSRAVFGRDIAEDGAFGKESCMAAQQWLKAKWGYSGSIDGIPGPGTHAAWTRAEAANAQAF